MSRSRRGLLIAAVVCVVGVVPFVHYRYVYTREKRLREMVPGRVYRMGQPTAAGFEEIVRRLNIRTVINLQDDYPDPDLDADFWTWDTVKESALCERLHVRYVFIAPDLVSRRKVYEERPAAVDDFLEVMDDESNYPVLIHCRAGLHRTGVLAAVYRMEYQGWSRDEAWRELRAHGFGEWASSAANDYVLQYVLAYRPGLRRAAGGGYCSVPAGGNVRP